MFKKKSAVATPDGNQHQGEIPAEYTTWDQPNPPKAIEHISPTPNITTEVRPIDPYGLDGQVVELQTKLDAVLRLHKAVGTDEDEDGTRPGPNVCAFCSDFQSEGVEFPCATARVALGG